MQSYVKRKLYDKVMENLKNFPVVALLGPRQCGKSTLAKHLSMHFDNTLYLDLEWPDDISKLQEPALFFQMHSDKLIILDEIQRMPNLFSILRHIVDANNRNGQFLILGSASRDLLKQSSETLAGRIAYMELTPFLFSELEAEEGTNEFSMPYWLRGGYPRSFLAKEDSISFTWRENFIKTFLERDIPQLGLPVSDVFSRLWRMCAHSHGQLFNYSQLGASLGLSHTSIRNYLDLFEKTFMIRSLPALLANVKKRILKTPKIFIRDSGILHALLSIRSHNDLIGHPIYGSSFEGFVIENIIAEFPEWDFSFYRTVTGAELDLVMTKGKHKFAIECKASAAVKVTKGFWNALDDLEIDRAWVIALVDDEYPLAENVMVTSLPKFLRTFKDFA